MPQVDVSRLAHSQRAQGGQIILRQANQSPILKNTSLDVPRQRDEYIVLFQDRAGKAADASFRRVDVQVLEKHAPIDSRNRPSQSGGDAANLRPIGLGE